MNYPVILVEHMINGRIRVRLSHSIIDESKLNEFFKEEDGIKSFRYNPYIKTLLVEFNSKKISAENVIFKIAAILSEIYGFSKIKFISNNNKTDMPLLSYYSIILIVGANSKIFKSNRTSSRLCKMACYRNYCWSNSRTWLFRNETKGNNRP